MTSSTTSKNNITEGEKHILITESIPKYDNNPMVTKKTMYLSTLHEDKKNTSKLLHEIGRLTRKDRFKLIINSPGGLINEGRSLINTLFSTGVEIETNIVSEAASMAAILFCIGEKRVIYENTSIMFHTFSMGTYGKGSEIWSNIEHNTENINNFMSSTIIGLSDDELQEMFDGKDFWFGAEEMAIRGIATHINIHGIEFTSEEYLQLLKRSKKQAKKLGHKTNSIEEALICGVDVIAPVIEARESKQREYQKEMNTLYDKYHG